MKKRYVTVPERRNDALLTTVFLEFVDGLLVISKNLVVMRQEPEFSLLFGYKN